MIKPLISVAMSTYNTNRQYLKNAIESILNQTYKNFEFIIICDGSEKDIEIINEYNDNRIKIIKHNKNMGLPYSLNEAIELAKGEYIARMDSDDIALSTRFEKQVEFLEKHLNIGVCSSFAKQFDEGKEYMYNVWKKTEELQCQLFFTNILVHPAVMFRKQFLIDNNLRYSTDYIYSQDFEFWTRISKKGNIAIIPEILLMYRVNKNQISTAKKEKQREIYESVLQRNLEELEIGKENIKYIRMLNGIEKNIDYEGLKKFIENVLKQNSKIKVYDENYLKNVLYNKYNNLCLKSKKININELLKLYNINYFFRKIYLSIKLKINYKMLKNNEIKAMK